MPAEYRAHTDHLAHDMYSVIRVTLTAGTAGYYCCLSNNTGLVYPAHQLPVSSSGSDLYLRFNPLVGHSIGAVIVTIVACSIRRSQPNNSDLLHFLSTD